MSDKRDILIRRKVNDRDGVAAILIPTGKLLAPDRESDWPHPKFLAWHREHHAFAA